MSEKANKTVAVIGAGAAGLMAALHAAWAGADVALFERGERPARKLRITGKGRCNVTNDCTRDEFFENITQYGRFLYAAWSRFSAADTMAFFEGLGVPLKVERGRRVFPVSDKAADVAEALIGACRAAGVRFITGRVTDIAVENGRVSGVRVGAVTYPAGAVILATGGCSYPKTGSDGDGFRMAAALGHTVHQPVPSLVPLTEAGHFCAAAQGLTLKNVRLTVRENETGKTVFAEQGELLFTHFGLSGPLALSASAHLSRPVEGRYTALIDLKPALDEKTLDHRLLADFEKYKNRDFINALSDLLPQKLIAPFAALSGIDGREKVNTVTREQRRRLLALFKALPVPLAGTRPIAEAIVTRGGVSPDEVTPGTMGSKRVDGLFFAGEVLDVDAYTGGFNLQIAFSTAVLAGEGAAAFTAAEKE